MQKHYNIQIAFVNFCAWGHFKTCSLQMSKVQLAKVVTGR